MPVLRKLLPFLLIKVLHAEVLVSDNILNLFFLSQQMNACVCTYNIQAYPQKWDPTTLEPSGHHQEKL